jgi:hypothetical protein
MSVAIKFKLIISSLQEAHYYRTEISAADCLVPWSERCENILKQKWMQMAAVTTKTERYHWTKKVNEVRSCAYPANNERMFCRETVNKCIGPIAILTLRLN